MSNRKRIKLFEHHISNEISRRYLSQDRIKNGKENVVIDTFCPKYFYNMMTKRSGSIGDSIPSRAKCISEFFADSFQTQRLTIAEMLEELGVDLKELSTALNLVKKNKTKLCLIGYGGTGVNFIYWVSEMCKLLGKLNIFEELHIYEPEKIEFSNILRFPKNISKINFVNNSLKLNIFGEEDFISKKVFLEPKYIDEENVINLSNDGFHFFGAPDIATRLWLSKYNFIAGLHGDDIAYLISRPKQDANIQYETYGKIRLNSFFMNQLKLAIGYIAFLAQEEIVYTDNDVLLEYNFMNDEPRGKYDFFRDVIEETEEPIEEEI